MRTGGAARRRCDQLVTTGRFWCLRRAKPRSVTWAFERKPSCRRGDLNPHVPKDTSPSSWRVCQFRHSDVALGSPQGSLTVHGLW